MISYTFSVYIVRPPQFVKTFLSGVHVVVKCKLAVPMARIRLCNWTGIKQNFLDK